MHVDIRVEGEILVVTAAGKVAYDSALRMFIGACDVSAEKQVWKILVNCLAVEGALSTLDRYRLGAAVSEYLRTQKIYPKIALVGIAPTMDGFGAEVAQNRGAFTELFATLDEALNWLSASGQ